MVELDDLLRGTLSERADAAPDATGLLGAVHDRSARLRTRRRIAMTAGAAAVAAALAVPAVVIGVTGGDGSVSGPAASRVTSSVRVVSLL